MTTTQTPTSTRTESAPRKLTKAEKRAAKDTRALVSKLMPGLVDYIESRAEWLGFADIEVEWADLCIPLHRTPMPATAEVTDGFYFDLYKVDRVVRFCRDLRHIEGDLAGEPLLLDLWQIVWVVAPVFGWHKPDGLRYFTELYLEVPRKNGKSTLAAALLLYLLVSDGEKGAQIVGAARDKEQAQAVFATAKAMKEASPELSKRVRFRSQPTDRLIYDATRSHYKVIASDKKGKGKHGLNLHAGVVDELHVIDDADFIDTIETGVLSRSQPLLLFITTAGIPAESPVWREKRGSVEKSSAGVIRVPGMWGVVFAAPPECRRDGSWAKPATWKRANPGYGRSVKPAALEKAVAKAKLSPARRNAFLRLALDVPTENVSAWMSLDTYDRSASIVDEADLVGMKCWGGLDLASTIDLAALVLIFPDADNEHLDAWCRFWTPADTMTERAERDIADYERWAEEGWLVATPGETIDFDFVEAEVVEALDTFEVVGLNYDPWGSKQLRGRLEKAGAPIWECRQGFPTLSPPTKELERLIFEQRFRHGGHPVLRYCMSGASIVQDPAGNMKPSRQHSTSRIDGVVASIMAVEAWSRETEPGRSVYEDREVEVVGA